MEWWDKRPLVFRILLVAGFGLVIGTAFTTLLSRLEVVQKEAWLTYLVTLLSGVFPLALILVLVYRQVVTPIKQLNSLVAQYARTKGVPHSHVHAELRREDLQERSGKDPVALALMHFPEQGQIRDFGFFAGTHAATFQIV